MSRQSLLRLVWAAGFAFLVASATPADPPPNHKQQPPPPNHKPPPPPPPPAHKPPPPKVDHPKPPPPKVDQPKPQLPKVDPPKPPTTVTNSPKPGTNVIGSTRPSTRPADHKPRTTDPKTDKPGTTVVKKPPTPTDQRPSTRRPDPREEEARRRAADELRRRIRVDDRLPIRDLPPELRGRFRPNWGWFLPIAGYGPSSGIILGIDPPVVTVPVAVPVPVPVPVPVGSSPPVPSAPSPPSVGDNPPPATEVTPTAKPVWQDRRLLRLGNATEERVTVNVQYRSKNDQLKWAWYPVDPKESTKSLTVTLEPGQMLDLEDDGWRVNANKARIWAKSASGTAWDTFKDKDLYLVPEQDKDGYLGYYAPEMQVFTFTVK
jgi:hypothetical protein